MRRIDCYDMSSVAEQVIVSAYGNTKEYDGECEEGYSYEEYSAETANLGSCISWNCFSRRQQKYTHSYEDTYLWAQPQGLAPAKANVHAA